MKFSSELDMEKDDILTTEPISLNMMLDSIDEDSYKDFEWEGFVPAGNEKW